MYFFFDEERALNGVTVAKVKWKGKEHVFTDLTTDKPFDYDPENKNFSHSEMTVEEYFNCPYERIHNSENPFNKEYETAQA